ncbi:MAG: Os1348 family NHLP clan protein [Egibacteraceae bacterium]
MVKDLEELIQRAIDEPDFRRRLFADPEEVVRTEGYTVSSETIAEIKKAGEAPPDAIDAVVEQMRTSEGRAG